VLVDLSRAMLERAARRIAARNGDEEEVPPARAGERVSTPRAIASTRGAGSARSHDPPASTSRNTRIAFSARGTPALHDVRVWPSTGVCSSGPSVAGGCALTAPSGLLLGLGGWRSATRDVI